MFGEFPSDSEIGQWSTWAMEVADDHDPLRAYFHRDNADCRNQSRSPIGPSSEHPHRC